MSAQFFSKLSQNYIEILEDNEYYDITIEVGKDPNVKIFRAHTIILCYRFPYLRRTLTSNKKNNDNALTHVKLPNVSPEIFQIILKYIYGGIISLNERDTSDILKILVTADELLLHELVDYLQIYLAENRADWIEQHFELVNRTSFQSNNLSYLQKFCTDFMTQFPEKLFKSLDFTSLPENSLVSLIKRDDLQMKEIEVWEHVLKWGIAQNPTLTLEPANWTDNDFKTMENTLQSCLPLIRFHRLYSKDFLEKVRPYKKLLKSQLYEDLLKYYLDPESIPSNDVLPPRYLKVDSKIININIVSLVSKWIDKVEHNSKFAQRSELYLPYEFKLLLRGSRDGFTPKEFHELCDNKPKTITFIKVKGTDEILGGYNPLLWEGREQYVSRGRGLRITACDNSFIFSFKNENNLFKDEIISNVRNKHNALHCDPGYGPSFGMSGSDLSIHKQNNSCKKCDYEKEIRDTEEFLIEDYEVFQIINKNE